MKVTNLLDQLQAVQRDILFPVPQPEEFVAGDVFTPYVGTETGFPEPLAAAEKSTLAERASSGVRPTRPRRTPGRRGGRAGGRAGRGREDRGGRGSEDPRERGYDDRRTGRTRTPAGGVSFDASRIQQANQLLNQAKEAFNNRNLQEAKALVDQVWSSTDLPESVRRKAMVLKQKIDPAYNKWLALQQKRQEELQREQTQKVEIWVFDMEAPPGKTCRYRARVVLFNAFCHPAVDRSELVNPQDGGKVVLVGDWSEPSPPVTIANNQWMFLTRADSRRRVANVDIFCFHKGLWYRAPFQVGVGDEIGTVRKVRKPGGLGERVDVDFRTGLVVVDIDYGRAVPKASPASGGGGFKLTAAPSAVLVCMDQDGAIEERWAVTDRSSLMYNELKEKVNQAAAAVPSAVGGLIR